MASAARRLRGWSRGGLCRGCLPRADAVGGGFESEAAAFAKVTKDFQGDAHDLGADAVSGRVAKLRVFMLSEKKRVRIA